MSEQPNVLWLASMLESCALHVGDIEQYHAGIALRRLHEVNAELLEALRKTKTCATLPTEVRDVINAAISRALSQSKGE